MVRPLQFPGGSIGALAVNGTVNDLAVSGAAPLAMLVTLVIEAGLPGSVLTAEIGVLAAAAQRARIPVIGGDTKVVEHGKTDGLYITTTGVGSIDPRVRCSPQAVRPGDRILLSGHIGDHGIAVLLARADIDLQADVLCSDTRSVCSMVTSLIETTAPSLRWMRDPTTGGEPAVIIGEIREGPPGVVIAANAYGGSRLVDMLVGDPLPRIC